MSRPLDKRTQRWLALLCGFVSGDADRRRRRLHDGGCGCSPRALG